MRIVWICLLATILGLGSARADGGLGSARADGTGTGSTGAFRQAYAASFYQFDACGDGLAGRIYRNALSARLRQCPLPAEAKTQFQAWAKAQTRKSSEAIRTLIDDNGGMPIRLQGMTRTCREQTDSPEYGAVRERLDAYAAGKSGPEAVVPQPCDADGIAP